MAAPAESAAATALHTAAAASTTAVRVPGTLTETTECERVAAAVAGRHGPAHDTPVADQQVIVRTAAWTDTTATVELATRTSGGWRCGAPMTARVGRSGVRPLLDRRSGDGTTPAGVFPLATMTAPDGQRFSFFGNDPDPGVTAGTYRDVRTGDCFGATPGMPGYGHLRDDRSCAGPDDEYLPRFVQAYTHAALIGANTEPDVSGDAPDEVPYAAAIFLHRHVYRSGGSGGPGGGGATNPTSGCVSLAAPDLVHVLTSLDADTVFAIGPTDWLLTSV
ncbi:MAG: hypothetical protein R2743_14445 [Ilumatobacteraceae bacterium]